jgi:threonine dehydratase
MLLKTAALLPLPFNAPGQPFPRPSPGSIAADSLAPSRVDELMFSTARANVAGVVQVSGDAIRKAQSAL